MHLFVALAFFLGHLLLVNSRRKSRALRDLLASTKNYPASCKIRGRDFYKVIFSLRESDVFAIAKVKFIKIIEVFLPQAKFTAMGETMNAKYNQSEQDYLESILNLSKTQTTVHRIDVAKRLDVSQAAVNKAMKLLVEKEYVYEDGKHLYLTPKGKKYAEEVYEKHCIIRDFLQKLGVSPARAEADACHLEHVVSDETFLAMKAYLTK